MKENPEELKTEENDKTEVYEVKDVATFEQQNSKTPFDVIDETLYRYNIMY